MLIFVKLHGDNDVNKGCVRVVVFVTVSELQTYTVSDDNKNSDTKIHYACIAAAQISPVQFLMIFCICKKVWHHICAKIPKATTQRLICTKNLFQETPLKRGVLCIFGH